MTKFEKPGPEDWRLPGLGPGGRRRRRSRTPGSPTTRSSRPTSATSTASRRSGQRAVYELGMTGIPVFNVNNNCSTGSTRAVPGGAGRSRGGLGRLRARARLREDAAGLAGRDVHRPRAADAAPHASCWRRSPRSRFPPAPWMFGAAGREHMREHGSEPEHFAKIGQKNHEHSVNNPYAQFQDEYTLDEILERADDLRAADQAPVLAHLRRRRPRRSSRARTSSSATGSRTRPSRSSARR